MPEESDIIKEVKPPSKRIGGGDGVALIRRPENDKRNC